jgi:hypothetical protein
MACDNESKTRKAAERTIELAEGISGKNANKVANIIKQQEKILGWHGGGEPGPGPGPGGPICAVDDVKADMLKLDLAEASTTAPGNTNGPNEPGYNTTLRFLDLSSAQRNEMVAAHQDRGYNQLVFYVRSGQNMQRVFGLPDFDYWDQPEFVAACCVDLIAAGIRPVPVLMSNQDEPWMPWLKQLERMTPVLRALQRVKDWPDPSVLLGIELNKNVPQPGWDKPHASFTGYLPQTVFLSDMIKNVHGVWADLKVWVHFTDTPWEGHPWGEAEYGNAPTRRSYGCFQQMPWDSHTLSQLEFKEWCVKGELITANAPGNLAPEVCVPFEYCQQPRCTEEDAIKRGEWAAEALKRNAFGTGGTVE